MKTLSLTVLIILVIIGAIYWHDKQVDNSYGTAETPTQVQTGTSINTATSTTPDYTPTDETSSTDVSTWKTYTAPLSLATLKYPADWTLSGMTLTSPKKDMTIVASYKKGTMPTCDPAICTQKTISGLTFNRSATSTSATTTVTYMTAKSGYVVTAVAKFPTDPRVTANTQLVDQIIGTLNIK